MLESLGLDGSIVSNTVTGSSVYTLGTNTSLSTINDGRGLGVRNTSGEGVWDISIELDVNNDLLFTSDEKIQVRLGDIEEGSTTRLKKRDSMGNSKRLLTKRPERFRLPI